MINGGLPVTLYSNMFTFRDSNKCFELYGDLLETVIFGVILCVILCVIFSVISSIVFCVILFSRKGGIICCYI